MRNEPGRAIVRSFVAARDACYRGSPMVGDDWAVAHALAPPCTRRIAPFDRAVPSRGPYCQAASAVLG